MRADGSGVEPSRLGFGELVAECVSALVSRPGRSILTTLGVVVGIGTYVSVVGLAGTASGQISDRFTVLAATTVTATDQRAEDGDPFPFPAGADARLQGLNGVTAAGVSWFVAPGIEVHGSPAVADDVDADLYAVSAGLWSAVAPRLEQGRVFDAFADQSAQPVVVLGSAVADRLGISTLVNQPAITLDGMPFTVVGILADTRRMPELQLSISIPRGTAEALWGTPGPAVEATALVETELGAAQQVAAEIPLALVPTDVRSVGVTPPPDPRSLRDGVGNDLAGLFVVLALICLLVGAVGIANTTLVAVIERTSEIGLRRALGATPRQIGAQVMAESAGLGLIGGLIGTSVGVCGVVGVALVQRWTAVMPSWLALTAPLVGLVVGAAAGAYPAVRAARIEPTEALRR